MLSKWYRIPFSVFNTISNMFLWHFDVLKTLKTFDIIQWCDRNIISFPNRHSYDSMSKVWQLPVTPISTLVLLLYADIGSSIVSNSCISHEWNLCSPHWDLVLVQLVQDMLAHALYFLADVSSLCCRSVVMIVTISGDRFLRKRQRIFVGSSGFVLVQLWE